ncbi:hypothetical protein LEP1GSC016_0164 [Leptospira borgpetersenii serovar Hardjo-bovis str. Sponselee]|uniref:Uncharacterized protein n=1 Tax=Leptospira borgpetersenii serovar Hardjo-bovis str. Sponselee TaxID=1303729 RepID=M6BHQ4_LEPBO|nr:hypothetical protein LBHB_16670 [Leptospira borgpetersenii serovar Hardjo]EMJ79252.1 hypothetical protein LEP1GSC016_0164 [Leptospira borgpetersenii serovar Hardjo-bovis str. Sponselee]
MALLPERYKREAKRILKVSDLVELNLKQIEEKIKEALKKIRVTFKHPIHVWDRYDYFFGDHELHA